MNLLPLEVIPIAQYPAVPTSQIRWSMSKHRIVLTAVALAACRLAYGDAAIVSGAAAPPGWAPAPEILAPFAGDARATPLVPRTQVIRGNDRVF